MADWYPSNYCQHYGMQWCSPPYDGPPHYPALPHILVVDLATPRLHLRRRRVWLTALDAALDDWEASGLILDGTRDPSFAYAPGTITVDLVDIEDGTAGQAAFGLTYGDEDPLPGAGWAYMDPAEFEKLFKAKAYGSIRAILGHEIGHCFGFAHAPPRACMDTDTLHNTRPTTEELTALNTYFFGGKQ